jgi:UDP-N-acetyl-D-mannosaminuronate dehydrogenase
MHQFFDTISIVGLGYIGLPTAAVFASHNVKVIGVDVNQHAVDTINRGQIHIVEPDLDMVVHAAVTCAPPPGLNRQTPSSLPYLPHSKTALLVPTILT